MSTIQHVEENAAVASRRDPLSKVERRRVRQVLNRYKKLADLYCTGCAYCMPCPSGVNVPGAFLARIQQQVYGLDEHARKHYEAFARSAVECVACGKCLPKCPQRIDVIAQLRETIKALDERHGTVQATVRPVRLEKVRRKSRTVGGALRVRIELNNISDRDVASHVSWEPRKGVAINAPRTAARKLSPFGKARIDVAATVSDLSGPVDLGAAVEADIEPSMPRPVFRVAVACREPKERGKANLGVPARVGAAEQLVEGSAKVLKSHGLRVRFSYDDAALIVRATVRDDLLAPAGPKRRTAAADRWVLFLDARRGRRFGAAGLEKGTLAVAFPALSTSRGAVIFAPPDLDAEGIDVATRRTRSGYSVTARVPLSLVGMKRAAEGTRLGMDLMLVSHNRAGKPMARLSWTGDPEPFRTTGLGGYLFLVG
jgi:heterodisulfide reductase subunit C